MSATSPSSLGSLRNVVIGVVTTVLGSGAVYYLGFQKKAGASDDFLVTKEATTNAWNSYVSTENMFFNNFKTLRNGYTDDGFQHYKEATLDEASRFKSDLKKILDTKNIDQSLSSLVERRLQAMEQWESKYNILLGNYERILQTAPKEERVQKTTAENSKFQSETNDIDQRFANDVGSLCQALNTKYGNNFNWSSLLMYQTQNQAQNQTQNKTQDQTQNQTQNQGQNQTQNQGNQTQNEAQAQRQNDNDNSSTSYTNTNRYSNTNRYQTASGDVTVNSQMLVGRWRVQNDWLYQYEDGRLILYQNGYNYTGTWFVSNNLLYYKYPNATQIYKITQQSYESFTAEMMDSYHSTFTATRVNQ